MTLIRGAKVEKPDFVTDEMWACSRVEQPGAKGRAPEPKGTAERSNTGQFAYARSQNSAPFFNSKIATLDLKREVLKPDILGIGGHFLSGVQTHF